MLIRSRDRFLLFSYFLGIIAAGSLLLTLPAAWTGPTRLRYIDALFTATSAVCVTGLISVDTALYSSFGRVVILLLIQFGGLGIISFMTIYLATPRGKISLVNRKLIGDYFIEDLAQGPLQVVRKVILFTLVIELAGSLLLFTAFRRTEARGSYFASLFHAVSAFCNAGFSLFSSSLESYVVDPVVNLTIMGLIVLGGLGFVVHEDVLGRISGRRARLSVHSRLVIRVTAGLVLAGLIGFLLLEWNGCMRALSVPQKVQAALFASVTPRTAGFDTIRPADFSMPSRLLTMILMYVGASPASTGGGIKTTTFFIAMVMILRGAEAREDIRVFRRKVSPGSVSRAMMYSLRALAILVVATMALTVSEVFLDPTGQKLFVEVVFEVFSAFGTVGLSLGLTPLLTDVGKIVIILTMFAGRVGMAALAITPPRRVPKQAVDVPEEEVLVG